MNLYIVVEGVIGEKYVYKNWVPLVNPSLKFVDDITAIQNNNFYIVSGGGYPSYFKAIDDAIADVNELGNVDRLVIAVDSEELSYEEKLAEVNNHLANSYCVAEIRVIIQHFCLETWALGNKNAIPQHPHSGKLLTYMEFYNVRNNDPELLPDYNEEELNRCQFAEKYLRRAFNEKYRNISYSKSNPKVLLHPQYFERIRNRMIETRHIQSFNNFLEAFV